MTDRLLVYSEVLPQMAEASQITAYVLNGITGIQDSVSQYRKRGLVQFVWRNESEEGKASFRFQDLVNHLRANRGMDASAWGLPRFWCSWLDTDLPIGGTLPAVATATLPFGSGFPIHPRVQCPGMIFLSLQESLQESVLRVRDRLVTGSGEAVSGDLEWLTNLRLLFAEGVSLVDITLHQFYFRAKFASAVHGWRFDDKRVGDRRGVRLMDKFKWIGKITGSPLDDARDELEQFEILKNLRNHLSHFDPPCFAYTLGDVASWLNLIPDLGRLLWKIRKRIGAQLTPRLVKMVLLPKVEVHRNRVRAAVQQEQVSGYATSTWPTPQESPHVGPKTA